MKKVLTVIGVIISVVVGLMALLIAIAGIAEGETFIAIFGFGILLVCIGFIANSLGNRKKVSTQKQVENPEIATRTAIVVSETPIEPEPKPESKPQKKEKSKKRGIFNPEISDYVIFDFETTGLNPKSDRIIQIGAVKIVHGEVVAKYSTYVNPMKNITKKITEINGITNEMVMDAPTEDVALPEFMEFIKKLPITAYNLSFDLNFLVAALDRIETDLGVIGCFDSLMIAKKEYPELPNHKLETVVKSISPNYCQNHDALDDCFAVKEILDRTTITSKMISFTYRDKV